jgi:hypothetical protein
MMIDPPSLNSGRAFCTVNTVPRTFTPKTLSKCASVMAPMGSKVSIAGTGEQDIDPPLFLFHGVVQPVKIGEVRGVTLHARDILADGLHRFIQFLLAAASDENVCSFLDEKLGGSQSHSRGASRDDCDFVL